MKTKSFILGAAACLFVAIVGGAWFMQAKQSNSRKENNGTDESINSQFINSTTTKKITSLEDDETGSELTIVSGKMNDFEGHPYYEIVVQNTTYRTFKKITYRLGDVVWEQYNVAPKEKFQAIAYDEVKEVIVISVDYENSDLFEKETSLDVSLEENKIIGKITNNGEREIYPSDIVLFVKNSQGVTKQIDIPYAGCFDPGLVMKKGENLEFSYDIEEGYTLLKEKGIVFVYSDLEFKEHTIQEYRDVL